MSFLSLNILYKIDISKFYKQIIKSDNLTYNKEHIIRNIP